MRLAALGYVFLVALIASCLRGGPAGAAEIAILGPDNWNEFVPQGKEVDAIYGDYVLRNDKLVAVIAKPVATRNANMTVKNVGGCLIDFTERKRQNDQFGAWYPLGKAMHWTLAGTSPELKNGSAEAELVSVRVAGAVAGLAAETTYTLADGADHLEIETKLTSAADKPIDFTVADEMRADGTVFVKRTTGNLAWAYDRWWDAAYGIQLAGTKTADALQPTPLADDRKLSIPAQGSIVVVRRAYVAVDANALLDLAGVKPKEPAQDLWVKAADEAGKPIPGAYVELKADDKLIVAGKTKSDGSFNCRADRPCQASVYSAAHGTKTRDVKPGQTVLFELPTAGTVVVVAVDALGGPIPCKVQFRGAGETKDPMLFDKTGERTVHNLYYSHDGAFKLDLPPGKYDCTISHGPEYDVVEQTIEVLSGSETQLTGRLIRSVDTTGWVSGDFHNHASPSGDNVSSQLGRVLNLLCENVEFAPCTEHNRISSYAPHLKRLKVENLMASCPGIELTSSPLPLGHNNAFPLHLHEHEQDNGAPLSDGDPEVQVARLALWDDRSEKLVQQNHPDLGWLLFDKNGDGKPDGGYNVLPHLDVIEVHPPEKIFDKPLVKDAKGGLHNNTIANWLQLLNQGTRTPGVVNTDAHYNNHGSGYLRNWIACPTDDPAKIQVLDIVHACEHGHIVMSTGPFLEVSIETERDGGKKAIPGDSLEAPGGKATLAVRVQCPNWFDVDRVQVFVNGRPDEKLNFTREQKAEGFASGVVKFERRIPLKLERDAHIIVATIGEHSKLGHVMGPENGKLPPVAVSNPIWLDVDGGGFTPNKDTLDAPLPVKSGTGAK